MNKPYIDKDAEVHQVGNIIFERDIVLANNTFIHAILDGRWIHVGGVWQTSGEWYYFISPDFRGRDESTNQCASALEGVNIVLRKSGVVTC